MYSTVLEKELVSRKINEFVTDNITKINTPLVYERPNCVTVGKFKILDRKNSYTVQKNSKEVAEFYNKSWAVAYAFFRHREDLDGAKAIQFYDEKQQKLNEERKWYQHHIQLGNKKGEYNRVAIFEDRLSRVEHELDVHNQFVKRLIESNQFV